MSEEYTAQATEAELRNRCDYRCLNGADCEGPHFMGYSLGPWSITGMMRQIDELRAEVERLTSKHGPSPACPECGMGGDVGGTEPNPIPF